MAFSQCCSASVVLAELLAGPAAARALREAGLTTYLDIMRLCPDKAAQARVAECLPPVFDSEGVCTDAARVAAHVIALIETSPSDLELATGLRIVDRMTTWPKAALRCCLLHHFLFSVCFLVEYEENNLVMYSFSTAFCASTQPYLIFYFYFFICCARG